MSDFSYKDFAALYYPVASCPPALAGSLDWCASFASDIASQLVWNCGSHFQTCAQIKSPTGEVVRLKGRKSVSGSDSEQDPQIWTTQITKVSPRLRTPTRWTTLPPRESASPLTGPAPLSKR